jgi:2-polyprenyl-6-methoxyphenol hydroxylase-like FAD-dependent oxidoreductase
MSKPSILISGAGIAGSVCAFFLSRAGLRTTVIERSPSLRTAGQQIDIRGAALQIVQRMGLEEAVRSKTTKEAGLALVDGNGKRLAEFPVDKRGMSFIAEIEIVRGELARIFYEASKEGTEYVFGDHVTALRQGSDKVSVTFANGPEREFDLVIGADGMGSKIRRLVFPDEKPMKPLGQYTSFFTIPYKKEDGTFAQWYNAPGGRCVLLRPDNVGATRAYLSIMSSKPAGYYKLSILEQKQMFRDMFEDAGWEALRVLEGMDKADDFYMQEIAQVKMEKWSKGRVVLLGDAGYCPSPISGMGTSLAIVGAYVLAGEIVACKGDWGKGLRAYEEKMMPFVAKAQDLPPGAPAIANPQTQTGIRVMNAVVGFVSWSGLVKGISAVMSKFSGPNREDKRLPLYDFEMRGSAREL